MQGVDLNHVLEQADTLESEIVIVLVREQSPNLILVEPFDQLLLTLLATAAIFIRQLVKQGNHIDANLNILVTFEDHEKHRDGADCDKVLECFRLGSYRF